MAEGAIIDALVFASLAFYDSTAAARALDRYIFHLLRAVDPGGNFQIIASAYGAFHSLVCRCQLSAISYRVAIDAVAVLPVTY
jgi:hypothetical protein